MLWSTEVSPVAGLHAGMWDMNAWSAAALACVFRRVLRLSTRPCIERESRASQPPSFFRDQAQISETVDERNVTRACVNRTVVWGPYELLR